MSSRRATRALSGLFAVGLLLALASPAAAHVTVKSTEASQGGYAKLTVRVPTESETASTTKVELALPAEHPLASVRVKRTPGWTATLKKETLPQPVQSGDREITEAVTEITWVAAKGAGVRPGEFQEFDVSVGPLPSAETMIFKAVQTYSDGKVVRWIEEPAEGAAEPEFPAPVLQLTPVAGAHGQAAASGSGGSGGDSAAVASSESSVLPLSLATAGLATGLAGVGLGWLALATARRRTAPTA